MPLFEPAYRDRARDFALALAETDPRVVSAAVVGSMALGPGDRWSDLDLTFAVDDAYPVAGVLADWTRTFETEFDAAVLFDLPRGSSIYRVFLLPGCLQVDLSFTPASEFGAIGPRFRLLFGEVVEKPFLEPRPSAEIFGYAVHHALRARFCIERGRPWQAAYWIDETRGLALSLACRGRGLPDGEGRGFDDLPGEVLERYHPAMYVSLEPDELLRALRASLEGLLKEAGELAERVEPLVRGLGEGWGGERAEG